MHDEFRKTIEGSDLVRNDTGVQSVQVVVSPKFAKAILEADRFIRTSSQLLGAHVTSLDIVDPDFASSASKGPYSRTVTVDGIGLRWHDSYPGGKSIAYLVTVGEIEDHAVKIGLLHPLAAHRGSYEVPLDNAYVVSNVENEIRSFAQRTDRVGSGHDDETVVQDMVTSIMHWHVAQGADVGKAVKSIQCGVGSFLTEHYDPEDRFVDAEVEIAGSVPNMGVVVWAATRSDPILEVDPRPSETAPAFRPS